MDERDERTSCSYVKMCSDGKVVWKMARTRKSSPKHLRSFVGQVFCVLDRRRRKPVTRQKSSSQSTTITFTIRKIHAFSTTNDYVRTKTFPRWKKTCPGKQETRSKFSIIINTFPNIRMCTSCFYKIWEFEIYPFNVMNPCSFSFFKQQSFFFSMHCHSNSNI